MLNIFGLKKQKQNKNITLEYTEHYKKSYLDYKLIIMLSNSTSVKQIKKESCTMKYKKKKMLFTTLILRMKHIEYTIICYLSEEATEADNFEFKMNIHLSKKNFTH